MKKNCQKNFILAITMVLLLNIFGNVHIVNASAADAEFTELQDLAHAKIGLATGSVQAILLPEMLPEAEFQEYNTTTDVVMALASGKIDAFSEAVSVYCAMLWEGQKFTYIDEAIDTSEYGFIFGKGMNLELQEEIDTFLSEYKENGKLAELEAKWFANQEPEEFLDYTTLDGDRGTIKVVIDSTMKPFSYVKNGKYAGYDIEFLTLFAEEYGYKLEISDAAIGAILSGITLGTYDIGASGITITEERKESVDFSAPYYVEEFVMIIQGNSGSSVSLDSFDNATLGVIDGSIYAGYSQELFPNAKLDSYPSFLDLIQCVKQGKIDGFLIDMPNYNAFRRTESGISYVDVPDYDVEIGYAFGKDENGDLLKQQMDELLEEMRADGTLDELLDYWCGEEEPTETLTMPEFPEDSKPLKVALDLSRKPFVYLFDEEYAGFEIEVLYKFCEKYGYKPEFESAQWTAGVAGLKEGKYDVLSCGLYITEERKESVNFCEPYLVADVVMVIPEDVEEEQSFWSEFKDGFEKTFIRENRWKLIVNGVFVTLLISLMATVGGTIFGFIIYMLSRAKNKVVAKVTKVFGKVYSRIIAGTPALVILMILFYVIFGKSDIDGIVVAIIGFILVFGSFVYNHLALTVEGVDFGQTEAAYALGYTRNKAFFKIILPQALKVFAPTYTGEVVGLIKATSVVGYIAVNDLTKVGDIIRSNTYEAFFPLIAVAVIYFLITWIVGELLGVLGRKFDVKLRKDKNILKGVKR